jgi:hypothetical protein
MASKLAQLPRSGRNRLYTVFTPTGSRRSKRISKKAAKKWDAETLRLAHEGRKAIQRSSDLPPFGPSFGSEDDNFGGSNRWDPCEDIDNNSQTDEDYDSGATEVEVEEEPAKDQTAVDDPEIAQIESLFESSAAGESQTGNIVMKLRKIMLTNLRRLRRDCEKQNEIESWQKFITLVTGQAAVTVGDEIACGCAKQTLYVITFNG